ncbi:hypothetical protein Tco_0450549 [Tanacetum coccineum]
MDTQSTQTIKLPILQPGEYDLWKMRMEQYLQCVDYTLWEIVEIGNAPIVTKTVDGKETVIPPTSVEESTKKGKIKGNKHFVIENRFGGNSATKKTQKNLLKQQYENFAASSTEVIEQTYERLQKLISQLEMHGEVISQEDINQKFLRSLSKEWTMHTIVWRNKPEIESLSLDDLFNNLKDYESKCDGFGYDWSDQAEEECVKDLKEQNEQLVKDLRTARISVVSYKTGLESVEAGLLVFKKNESVYVEDIKLLKSEIYLRYLDITELKRKLDFATKEKDEIMDKCKTGLGYNVVPPPYTENFMPPKSDLVYPSLDDFVDVNESVSKPIVEKPTIETN